MNIRCRLLGHDPFGRRNATVAASQVHHGMTLIATCRRCRESYDDGYIITGTKVNLETQQMSHSALAGLVVELQRRGVTVGIAELDDALRAVGAVITNPPAEVADAVQRHLTEHRALGTGVA